MQGVDAQVTEGAPSERGIEDVRPLARQHMVVSGGALLVPERDPADAAESRQHLLDRADAGVVGRAHGLEQHDTAPARVCDETLPLLGRERRRLFDEHRDAGIHRRPYLRGVDRVGAGDVHGVDVAAVEEPLESVGRSRRSDPFGELPSPDRVARRHRAESDAVHGAHGVRQTLGDGTGADDADADHPLIIPCPPAPADP